MDRVAFDHMAATEDHHWWFVGRRAVISALIRGIGLPRDGDILEAGCGTGGNIAMLQRFGRVAAFEPHIDALAYTRQRHPDIDVREGRLPDALPHESEGFDLVAALDVLEHVEDDRSSARALAAVVKPGGWLLVTVPAHQALWGSHDRRLHHLRRYGRADLLAMFDSGSLELVRFTAFNSLLSPVAIAYRLAERFTGLDLGNQERVPPPLLNSALGRVFSTESWLIARGMSIPAGISYAAVFRKHRELH